MNGAETQLPLSKRLLAVLFALVLVVGMAPVSAWAEGEGNAQDSANTEQLLEDDSEGGAESESQTLAASLYPTDTVSGDVPIYFQGSSDEKLTKKYIYNELDKKWGSSITIIDREFYLDGKNGTKIKDDSKGSLELKGTGTVSYEVGHKNLIGQYKKDGTLTFVEKPTVTNESQISDVTYDGDPHKWTPVLKAWNGTELNGDDYSVVYTRNGQVTEDFTNAGTIEVSIKAQKGYTGEFNYDYTIMQAEGLSVAGLNDVTYNGETQEQKPTVTDANDNTLTEGTDYDVTYSDDTVNAGAVTVTVAGKGNYTGTVAKSYQITPKPYGVITETASKPYDGKPLTAGGKITGLVNEGDATLTLTGTQTDAGKSDNSYEIKFSSEQMAKNYKLDAEEVAIGTLEVTPAEVTVSVSGNSGAVTYDGTEQFVKGFKVTGVKGASSDLFNEGSVVLAESAAAEAKGTDADTYLMNLNSGSFVCEDGNFEVTAFDVTDGFLTINKRVIEASNSASVVYNGQEQVLNITEANATGLVDGDELYLKNAQVKGTEPGTYTDVTEYSWTVISGNLIVNNNYDLKVTGELTITKADSGSGSGSATDNGNTGKADKTDKAKASSASPQTGDSIAPFAMAAGIIAIAAALAAFFVSRKLRGTTRR